MSNSSNQQEESYQHLLHKQKLLLDARDRDLTQLRQKIFEYERALTEKDYYLARLEMDLEHAITQCKKFAAERMTAPSTNNWLNRHPGLESK